MHLVSYLIKLLILFKFNKIFDPQNKWLNILRLAAVFEIRPICNRKWFFCPQISLGVY